MAEEWALLDSGATENFIDAKIVVKMHLGTQKLVIQWPVYNVDGSPNWNGVITHAVDLLIKQGNWKERQHFYITNLGKDTFILRYPWFRTFNPTIDWANGKISGPLVKMETIWFGIYQEAQKWIKEKKNNDLLISKADSPLWSRVTTPTKECGWVEINHANTVIDMAHQYVKEHAKEEVKLPEQFKRDTSVCSDKEANKFPPSWPWDHKIDLIADAPASFNCKVYPMLQKEQEAEDKFLDENLAKGYIVSSESPYRFSTFMVPKKDSNKKRYIIDYWPLNAITRKDVIPLPNLAHCIEDLQGMELFSKFNMQWGYNNIWIRDGDQWKGAFKTRRGLFEPKVMFFGMCNSPAAFQWFMNTALEPWYQKYGRKKGKNYIEWHCHCNIAHGNRSSHCNGWQPLWYSCCPWTSPQTVKICLLTTTNGFPWCLH